MNAYKDLIKVINMFKWLKYAEMINKKLKALKNIEKLYEEIIWEFPNKYDSKLLQYENWHFELIYSDI